MSFHIINYRNKSRKNVIRTELDQAPFLVCGSTKSIKGPISHLKLTRWLKSGYLGFSKTDRRSNNLVNWNQTSAIRIVACARPTSKGGSVDHQKSTMANKLKDRASFFSANEQEMIMNASEDFQTIIMAKSKGAFTPKAKLFFASPKTREFTRSTVHRVLTMSVETLCEGRGLSPCLFSVKTVIISFIHQNN